MCWLAAVLWVISPSMAGSNMEPYGRTLIAMAMTVASDVTPRIGWRDCAERPGEVATTITASARPTQLPKPPAPPVP